MNTNAACPPSSRFPHAWLPHEHCLSRPTLAWRLDCPLWALALCCAAMSGCKVDEGQSVKIVTSDSPPLPGPKPEKGIVIQDDQDAAAKDSSGDEESLEELAQRQKSKKTVFVKPGETIQLFSEWSSIVPEDLMALNDGKPFRYGQKWAMSLTAAEYDEFERKRKEHWDKRKNEYYSRFDIKLVEYTVKRSDTMESIAKKNKVDLWFLALHNPTIDPYKLSMGAKVFIPVLMNRKKPPEDDTAKANADPLSKSAGKHGKESAKGTDKATGETGEEGHAGIEEGIPIVVKRGESLGVYAKWGGFALEELERLNPGISSRMLREGDTVRVPLTAEQLDEFQKKRAKGKKGGKPTTTPPGDIPLKEPKDP